MYFYNFIQYQSNISSENEEIQENTIGPDNGEDIQAEKISFSEYKSTDDIGLYKYFYY